MDYLNPFKGPESYTVGDNLRFYGRDNEKTEMCQLIEKNTLTLLYSQSGCGKSSLINAGIISNLSRWHQYIPFVFTLPASKVSWEDYLTKDIIGVIETSFDNLVSNGVENKDYIELDINDDERPRKVGFNFEKKIDNNYLKRKESLFEFLYSTSLWCTLTKEQTNSNAISNKSEDSEEETIINEAIDNEPIRFQVVPVIIFDQFEELFTTRFLDNKFWEKVIDELCCPIEHIIPPYTNEDHNKKKEQLSKNSYESLDYFNQLKNKLTNTLPNFRFLFSFREEYLTKFESLSYKISALKLGHNRFCLFPFEKEKATKVIKKISPEIENTAGFAEAIVAKLENKPDARGIVEVEPFVLSLFCYFIYDDILEKSADSDGIVTSEKLHQSIIDEYNKFSNLNTVLKNKEDVIDAIADEYCKNVFSNFKNTVVQEAIAELLVIKDTETNIYRRKLVLKEELMNDKRLGHENVEILLGSKPIAGNKRLRYLKPETFVNDEYIHLLHDKLVRPLINIKEEKEKNIKKKKRLIWILPLVLSMLFVFIFLLYVIYSNAIARQNIMLGKATSLNGTNPTMAYLLAKNINNSILKNSELKNFISSFDSGNQFFLISRISMPDPINSVYINDDSNTSLVSTKSGIYKYLNGKLCDWTPVTTGTLLAKGIINGKLNFLIQKVGSDTCELRDNKGTLIRKFGEMDNSEYSYFSPNGKNLLIGNLIYHLDSIDKHPDTLRKPAGDRGWMCSGFCPDGSHLYAGFWNGQFIIYSLNGHIVKAFVTNENAVITSLSFSKNMKYAISGDHENLVRVWDVGSLNNDTISFKRVAENVVSPKIYFQGHNGFVNSVFVLPGDSLILSGGEDNNIILWNFKGERKGLIKGAAGKIKSLGSSQDGQSFYAINDENRLYIWKKEKASTLYQNKLLYIFSPLDYASAGVTMNNYATQENNNTFDQKVKAVEILNSSIPYINQSLSNTYYSEELSNTISKTKKLYVELISDKMFKNLDIGNQLLLRRNFAHLLILEPELIPGKFVYNDTIPGTNLVNNKEKKLYTRVQNQLKVYDVLFRDTVDIFDAISYSNNFVALGNYYCDSSYFKIGIPYIKQGIDLAKGFNQKFKDNDAFNSILVNGYIGMCWAYIYKGYKDSIAWARSNYLAYSKNDYMQKAFSIIFSLFAFDLNTTESLFLKIKDEKLIKNDSSDCYKSLFINELPIILKTKPFLKDPEKKIDQFVDFLRKQKDPSWLAKQKNSF